MYYNSAISVFSSLAALVFSFIHQARRDVIARAQQTPISQNNRVITRSVVVVLRGIFARQQSLCQPNSCSFSSPASKQQPLPFFATFILAVCYDLYLQHILGSLSASCPWLTRFPTFVLGVPGRALLRRYSKAVKIYGFAQPKQALHDLHLLHYPLLVLITKSM